jgi:hypothetical protein
MTSDVANSNIYKNENKKYNQNISFVQCMVACHITLQCELLICVRLEKELVWVILPWIHPSIQPLLNGFLTRFVHIKF